MTVADNAEIMSIEEIKAALDALTRKTAKTDEEIERLKQESAELDLRAAKVARKLGAAATG